MNIYLFTGSAVYRDYLNLACISGINNTLLITASTRNRYAFLMQLCETLH